MKKGSIIFMLLILFVSTFGSIIYAETEKKDGGTSKQTEITVYGKGHGEYQINADPSSEKSSRISSEFNGMVNNQLTSIRGDT